LKYIQFIAFNSELKKTGVRWVVGRSTNARAMHFHKRLGAVQLKETMFEFKGKKFPLFFFEIDLHAQAFIDCENSLPKLLRQEKASNKVAKL
jgi:hypothetical protein